MLEVDFDMNSDDLLGSFHVPKDFHDLFEENKNYYMWVETVFAKYKFTIQKRDYTFGPNENLPTHPILFWKLFNLKGIDVTTKSGIYAPGPVPNDLHWKKSQITKVEAIPTTEQVTGPFAKIHWGDNFTPILSEKSYIWIKVGDYYITPQFLDVSSFLYREQLLAWEKTGSRSNRLELWIEEEFIPMAINRGVI